MTFVFWFVILKSNFDFLVTVAAPETPHITYFVHSFQHIHIKCFYLASHHLLQGLHPFYWYVIFLLMSCLLLSTRPLVLFALWISLSPPCLCCVHVLLHHCCVHYSTGGITCSACPVGLLPRLKALRLGQEWDPKEAPGSDGAVWHVMGAFCLGGQG